MKKRLLAALLACCMAAGMAGTVFAAEELPPPMTETAVTEQAEPAPEEAPPEPAAEAPAEEPAPQETEAAPEPTEEPPAEPTAEPAPDPTATPEAEAAETPAPEPAVEPTAAPTPAETEQPTPAPTEEPTPEPVQTPEPAPTAAPTAEPTAAPTVTPAPTAEPTAAPEPTPIPTPAATVVPASEHVETPETARTLEMETLLDLAAPTAVTAVVTSVELVDSIAADGCFTAKVNGSTDKLDGAAYTWYRSKDGTNWEEVTPQICSGTAWNITEGSEQQLNAALDSCVANVSEAERLYYRVTVTGTDGGAMTAQGRVPYYIQLQNGSFETPDVAANSGLLCYPYEKKRSHFIQTPDAAGNTENIVWQTTGVAPHWATGVSGNYIEIVDGTNHSYTDYINGSQWPSTDPNDPSVCYHTQSAYDGSQFAELNCEAYGALYQDVLTVPGTTLHWSLAHRGRAGEDSMALLIAPVSVAQDITAILTQASADTTGSSVRSALDKTVTYNGEQVPIRQFMVGGEMTDGNTQWVTHRGDYTVAAGQYVSRFFFLALSCASGDRREGNLLDKVWFSTEAEPPVAGHANLTVRKTILGSLTEAELTAVRANLTFTVTRSDGEAVGTVRGADMTPDAADPTKYSYTLQDLPVTNDTGTVHYTYTVAETSYTAPAGLLYLGSRVAINGDDWQTVVGEPRLADITLAQNATTYTDFENTYARQTGSLHLRKAVADETLRTEADAVTNTFTVGTLPIGSYTLVFEDGTTETRTLDAPGDLTIELTGLRGVTIENLPVGRYTVTETDHPDLANYYCTTTAAAATAAAQVPSGEMAEVTITNTYAPFRRVTITKQVTGGYGDTRRGFAFTATVDGVAVDRADLTVSGGAALTADGFTIPHRGSVTIGHLKPGQTFTITEETLADYETSFDDGSAVTVGNAYSGTVGAGDTALTCVNNKDGVPPTGLAQDVMPAVWLLALGLACAAVFCRRKRV